MAARDSHVPPPVGLSRETIASLLGHRRDRLVRDVPRKVAAARGLTRDQHESIVDEAISFVVMSFSKPLPTTDDLERVIWKAIRIRVAQTSDGRHEVVRSGWERVELESIESVADDAPTPEDAAVRHFELETLREFEAVLTPHERAVLAVKHSGQDVLGRFEIAKVLGERPFEVRRAERAIARKLAEFAEIVAAGRLCDERHDALEALAQGAASEDQLRLARSHLLHCTPCRGEYKVLLRAARTGELQRQIGQLLPPPTIEVARSRRGPWEVVVDWCSRPFGHDATVSLTQLAPAGRGLSTLAGAKLLALCVGGITAVSGGIVCVSELAPHSRPRPEHAAAKHRPRPEPMHIRMRPVATVSTPTPTPTATPKPTLKKSRTRGGEVSGGASSHEKAAAITPPATTSSGDPVDEFGPGPSSTAPQKPAAAPANGGPEFP
jgi:hypothetical protein